MSSLWQRLYSHECTRMNMDLLCTVSPWGRHKISRSNFFQATPKKIFFTQLWFFTWQLNKFIEEINEIQRNSLGQEVLQSQVARRVRGGSTVLFLSSRQSFLVLSASRVREELHRFISSSLVFLTFQYSCNVGWCPALGKLNHSL